jgi:predicted nucleotidyltransferase
MTTHDLTVIDPAEYHAEAGEGPFPSMFVTVAGAHLYGYPAVDSKVDLRGVHLLPASAVVGLRAGPEFLDRSWEGTRGGVELLSRDLAPFSRLMLGRDGSALEQLLSPLVVRTSSEHQELIAMVPDCVTRHHGQHYRAAAQNHWRVFVREAELAPLLGTFRTLLAGLHLLRTGRVEANLSILLDEVPEAPTYVRELVLAALVGRHRTLASVEGAPPADAFTPDVEALHLVLGEAENRSALPDHPRAEPALHDLLVRLRLAAEASFSAG